MKRGCTDFRRRLEAVLAGRPDPPGLTQLGWHEHLLGCAGCRALLAHEEALELLLASLPEPQLPPDLRRRVLAALRERDAALDELLALDEVEVPSGLSGRVLERVAGQRQEQRLDALLDLVPREEAPAGLARRVLSAVHTERARRLRWQLRLVPPAPWQRAAGLLAVGLLAVLAWRATRGAAQHVEETRVANGVSDDEVIAMLSVLEYWDALGELDPLEQEIVARLDVSDEAFLDSQDF